VRLPGELQRRLHQRGALHRRRCSAASQVKTLLSVGDLRPLVSSILHDSDSTVKSTSTFAS
jgi:hypothetical protein